MDGRGLPRRWCREVLALRNAASDLLDSGTALTDPRMLNLSRRLDRLMLAAFVPQMPPPVLVPASPRPAERAQQGRPGPSMVLQAP